MSTRHPSRGHRATLLGGRHHGLDRRLTQELTRASKEECWSALAQALVDGDTPTFLSAFSEALASHEARTEKLARGFTQREDHFGAHRHLWFEGLALLRLARRRGLDVPNERYRYCPPLAQVPMTEPYQGDWVTRLGDAVSGA
ncbi:MAG TPA: hypothetical protein VFZ09_02515 [Archangium sp.]|uniref:hypothetical protein n=1 Tax=Archangium sp. TaxID=1872627 RepID=UPI002E34EDC1|nr:hypothetical protein [Archangium sp.]HEX5745085.1 hypothetical protein [Archangium sp.]